MQYMRPHYLHNQFYRIKRDLGSTDNNRFLCKTDVWGGFYAYDGSVIPKTRVIYIDEIRKQAFYQPHFVWKKKKKNR